MKSPSFTERQVAIIKLIAIGLSFEEIGEELGIVGSTAKHHADAIRHKLRVEKRRDIADAYWKLTGDNPYPKFPGS